MKKSSIIISPYIFFILGSIFLCNYKYRVGSCAGGEGNDAWVFHKHADSVQQITAQIALKEDSERHKIKIEEIPVYRERVKPTELENYFSAAYKQFPIIPIGLLEAIAYDRTKIQLVSPYREMDTIIHYDLYNFTNNVSNDIPKYLSNNLIFNEYCKKNKIDIIDFLNDEKSQILFVATELVRLKNENKIVGNQLQDFDSAIDKLFGYLPLGDGFKSYPGNITICYHLLKGFETREVKLLPNRKLLNYYNSIRALACMEEKRSRTYDEE